MSEATLWCGDCLELMKNIPDGSIDLTVTSPPYDNLRTYNGNISQWSFEKFQEIAKELYRATADGGVVVWVVNDATIKGSETGTSFRQALWFKEIGFNLHDTMIWEKISPFQHKNRYIQNFEYMFVLSKGKPKTANLIQDRKNKYSGTKIHGTDRQKMEQQSLFLKFKLKRWLKITDQGLILGRLFRLRKINTDILLRSRNSLLMTTLFLGAIQGMLFLIRLWEVEQQERWR